MRASIASAPSSGFMCWSRPRPRRSVALIYLQKARISPEAAFSVLDWNVLFIVIIGGFGTIEGPTIGVIVFYAKQHYLADFGTWYLILLGALAIATMLFDPKICRAALPRCAISRTSEMKFDRVPRGRCAANSE